MNGAALFLLAQAFTYHFHADPLTDEMTHVARAGVDGGPYVAIQCGAATGGELAVVVNIGRGTFNPPEAMAARYQERVRFDDGPVMDLGFRYDGVAAFLTGPDASAFIGGMKQAHQMVAIELADVAGEKVQVFIPITGANASIAAVEANCPA